MITKIGHHIVQCGNIIDGIDNIMGAEQADIFYSDPPWGAGNLKYWETMRLKMTGASVRRENNIDEFLYSFFLTIQKYAKNAVFIEYGKKWRDQMLSLARGSGLRHETTIETLYQSGSKKLPMDLHVFSKHGITLPADYNDLILHTQGWDTISRATHPFAVDNGIFLDPCCGLGYSARAAVSYGMRFRGNELNPKRLQKTIERLQ